MSETKDNLTQSLYEVYVLAYMKKHNVTRDLAEKELSKLGKEQNEKA